MPRPTISCVACPARDFYVNSRAPIGWLSVTASSEMLLSWLAVHECEVNFASLNRNSVHVAGQELDRLVRLCRRCFQLDESCPDDIHAPRAERALRFELLDAMMETQLQFGAHSDVKVRTLSGTRTLQRAPLASHSAGGRSAHSHGRPLPRHRGVRADAAQRIPPPLRSGATCLPDADAVKPCTCGHSAGETRGNDLDDLRRFRYLGDCGRFARHYHQMYGRFPSEDLAERRNGAACH